MVDLTLNILDGSNFPTLQLLEATGISIIINTDPAIEDVNTTTVSVTENTFVTITVSKDGYITYSNTVSILEENVELNIVLESTEIEPCDYINITEESCRVYNINNIGTASEQDLTFTITDLDYTPITNYSNIELAYGSTSSFTSASDNVYIVIFRNTDNDVICQMIIIDLCSVMSCVTSKIQDILCPCDCGCNDCEDFCKKDYDLKRIFVLGFDLFNRVNREYRLNSFYTTIDQAKINDLKTAKDVIDKLVSYCSDCGSITTDSSYTSILSSNSNTDCGCS